MLDSGSTSRQNLQDFLMDTLWGVKGRKQVRLSASAPRRMDEVAATTMGKAVGGTGLGERSIIQFQMC